MPKSGQADGDQVPACGGNARLNQATFPDFVVARTNEDNIQIGLGNGSGGIAKNYTYSMGNGPADVATGDFNGDGYRDIATASFYDDQVTIRSGSNYWQSWSKWSVGDGPRIIQVADVNGDKRSDFATVDALDDTITLRRHLPSGGFDTKKYPADAQDMLFADCDRDGDLDMLHTDVVGDDYVVRARRNDGHGNYQLGPMVKIGSRADHAGTANRLVAGDLNHDGRNDVIVTRGHSMIRLLGKAGCAFTTPVIAATESNPWPVKLVDLDKDGHLDIVLAHFRSGNNISVYLGDGTGHVGDPTMLTVPGKLGDVDTADFNLDGSPDIIVSGDHGAHLLLSAP